jgi:hypothetical protein
VDVPITDHPQFGLIQWNQSYSHMPWEQQVRAAAAKVAEGDAIPTNMDEPATEAEEKESITMGRLYYQFLCDELSFLRFELADQRIEALEEKFLVD